MSRNSRWFGLLIPAALLACNPPPPSPANTADVEAAVNAIREREVAMAAAGNVDSMNAVYADDVVIMPPGEPAVNGLAAAKEWGRRTFEVVNLAVNYTTSHITVSGDLAVDHYSGTLTATPKAGGIATTEQVKGVHVHRRGEDGSWKIVLDVWNSDSAPRQ